MTAPPKARHFPDLRDGTDMPVGDIESAWKPEQKTPFVSSGMEAKDGALCRSQNG
jgi:hypothetical protein